jgi:adenylosuccinate synthase
VTVTVVVGTQWGDEGKAKVIDLLARDHDVVARYQGGHNAGHTVVAGGERYALQLVPSGVLYDHVTPVIGNGVVLDLPTLFAEIDGLEARGVSCARLRVSSRAHLIFPWHQAHDALAERRLGDARIGTTLKGIGPAYADKARRVGLRAGDARDARAFASAVREAAAREAAALAAAGAGALATEFGIDDPDAVAARWAGLAARLAPMVCDTVTWLHEAHAAGRRILLEGAQATFLDLDHGTYPFVTSSSPTAGGAAVGSGLGPRTLGRIVGIAKAYTTRVGGGPFPTEMHGEVADRIVEVGHEFGTVTGRRRRPGWLDLVMLRHAVRVNSLTEIALTKIDVLDGLGTVRACVGYRDGSHVGTAFPDDAAALARVTPEYVDLPGWAGPLRDVRRMADLPLEARALVALVEEHAGVPVTIVGVGPGRDEVAVRS